MSFSHNKAITENKNVDEALALLRSDIQQGRFAPGQRLIEIDVMQHLGISRGRVREVFKRLESEGLVQIDKNRGASVRKASREEVENIFEVLEEISHGFYKDPKSAGLYGRKCPLLGPVRRIIR